MYDFSDLALKKMSDFDKLKALQDEMDAESRRLDEQLAAKKRQREVQARVSQGGSRVRGSEHLQKARHGGDERQAPRAQGWDGGEE